ncbi:MAG: FAD-binding protein [Saprospiraceae bacterium]|nr:FAD-binding protein [Saprospiraceae bacterium]
MNSKQNLIWKNRGGNLRSTVAHYFEPKTVAEVQAIVKKAFQENRKVRVVGDSHSWSPLCVTEDFMINTAKYLNKVLSVTYNPDRIIVEPGATVADTLKAYRKHSVVLPMNVDVPPITIAGAISVGANGFSRHWGTYSEFVQELEVVTGTGELKIINRDTDFELWQAACLGLGLFGIITKITLNLVKMFHVRVVEKKIDMAQALAETPTTYLKHDYCQYFWFPYNDKLILQTSDITTAPTTWRPFNTWMRDNVGWLQAGATHLIGRLLQRRPKWTVGFNKMAFSYLKEGDHVMLQSDNVMLGQWINGIYRNENCSVSFPVDEALTLPAKAWMMAVDLLGTFKKEGKYPVSLEMNMRLFGESKGLLDTLPSMSKGQLTCNIQITSFPNDEWENFEIKLMEKWLSIPGSRPHWAKQFQNIPNIAETLHRVYGKNLTQFLDIREQSNIDPQRLFVNPFLENLLFSKKRTLNPV